MKNILIVGATSSLAEGIIQTLPNKFACHLILTGRSKERLETVISRNNLPESTEKIVLDLENDGCIQDLANSLSNIDGLVFCAGVNEYVPIKFLKTHVRDKIFNVNYFSFVTLIKFLIHGRRINKGASVVAISSISSQLGVQGTAAYSASKAALNSTIKVLASELSVRRIRANAICPGIIISPMLDQLNLNKEDLMKQENQYPLGFGSPSDIGFAVSYLLSDESRWITGNILNIDGGLTLS